MEKHNNNKIIFKKEELKDIINLYTIEMYSINKIAKKIGVSDNVVKRVLKENNIAIRDNNIYKKKI